MAKEWFIKIENKIEGPFDCQDLKRDPRVTPDTLVKRKGSTYWVPLRFVRELQDVFKDDPEGEALHEKPPLKPLPTAIGQDQATLVLQQDPSQFILWLLLLIIALFYTFYHLYG